MRWVRQSDGRLLEYATCGRSDGVPVYWATGYFQTANFFPKYACEGAERLGLRLKPVHGPLQPGRVLLLNALLRLLRHHL